MKLLPLDTSSFRRIREGNYIYVDKTRWIYKLITEGICYFFSRPRRFGKSLTISTLKELFKGHKELFKGLWIYERWAFKEYPVVVFDFNRIENTNPEVLKLALKSKLLSSARDYELELKEDLLSSLFAELILWLFKKYSQKVVILIDEYDKPIIDHLGFGEERLKIAEQNREVLKRFFGVLKGDEVVDALQFVFVTGVSRFTKVSIFSEWNNLQDITLDSAFADFLGYSEEEIKTYFSDYLTSLSQKHGLSLKECLKKMAYWYNGYRFSLEKEVRIYNPISVMYCLKNGSFRNYWFQTATPSFLVNLLKERNYHLPKLECVPTDQDLLETFALSYIRIEPLLFQTGYLTIKEVEDDIIYLSYPNEEVKQSFSKILMRNLIETPDETIYLARRLGKAFKEENYEKIKEFTNAIFASLPYELYKKADEAFFHTIMYLSLALLGYDARSEVLTARGRLDMAVYDEDKVYIIEFKCHQNADLALKQIKEKGYAERWVGSGKKVILMGIDFDREKRRIREMKVEVLEG